MLYVLFGVALVLLILLTATALYFVLQKKEEKEYPTIHASGIYSLVRQSPREMLEKKHLTLDQVKEVLKNAANPENINASVEKYWELWEDILENSINTIENGDKEGLQTFSYSVPSKDKETCKGFSENIYATREQLHNYPNIIPPFHLGCQVRLETKDAWKTKLDGTGWKPLLPVGGKYPVPDWRIVGKIEDD